MNHTELKPHEYSLNNGGHSIHFNGLLVINNAYNQTFNYTLERGLVLELNETNSSDSYELLSSITLVFIEKSKKDRPLEKLSAIEQLVNL